MILSGKPSEPYKKNISPSSFYNIQCKRCLWIEYWHGIKMPVDLSAQQQLARLQESAYDGVESTIISDLIPLGYVTKYKKRFYSAPIEINGDVTRWKIYGEIDLIVDHHDGTFSIIDGKVSLKKDEESLIESYWRQQEAYVYSFENPLEDQIKIIKTIGLLQWRINDTFSNESGERGFKAEHRYIPISRNPKGFLDFIEIFISVIEGEFPESSENCKTCNYLKSVGHSYE